MVDTCLVTGTLTDAGGVGLAGQTISIKPNSIMTSGPGAILPDEVFVVTGAGGSFSGSFVPGLYRMTWWHVYREYWTAFIVPDMETATLRQVVDGANGVHSIPMPGPKGDKGDQGDPGQVGPGALNPTNSGYTSRAGLVSAVAAGDLDDVPDGMVVLAAGLQYVKNVGSTVIPDLNDWEPSGVATPGHWGSGDNAVESAMRSGLPLNFGGLSYSLSRQITVPAPTGNIQWYGEGARISYNGSSYIQSLVNISSIPDGVHEIQGIRFDGNNLCCLGLHLQVSSGSMPLVRVNCQFENCKRVTTTYNYSASGFRFDGGCRVIDVSNCVAKNITIASGAGTSGNYGAHAICIRASGGRPDQIIANSIYVENVYCDDLTYTADQDGLLVWVDRSAFPTTQTPTKLVCVGAFFKNCLTRAIKGQVESHYIAGTRVVRTIGHDVSSPIDYDIDLQVGGGRISGFSALYDGEDSAPLRSIILTNTDEAAKPGTEGIVDGLDIVMQNGAGGMESAVFLSTRRSGPVDFSVSGIRVSGGSLSHVVRAGLQTGSVLNLYIDDVVAAPSTSILHCTSNTWTGKSLISRVRNSGSSAIPAFTRNTSGVTVNVSTLSCENLLADKFSVVAGDSVGDMQKVTAISPVGATVNGGSLRPVTFRIAQDQIFTFPDSYFSGTVGILIVSCASNRLGQGMFAVDNSNITVMHQSAAGTSFTVGGGTEPASGDFRLWIDTTNSVIKLSNRTATTRTFTCWMMG